MQRTRTQAVRKMPRDVRLERAGSWSMAFDAMLYYAILVVLAISVLAFGAEQS
jgi:uncharacterized RDD family membrane protein YckC